MSSAPPPPNGTQAVGAETAPGPRAAPPAWDSAVLLAGATQAFIVHRGETYRLQLTRQGKLILTK